MAMLTVIVDGDGEREKIVTHKCFVDLCIFLLGILFAHYERFSCVLKSVCVLSTELAPRPIQFLCQCARHVSAPPSPTPVTLKRIGMETFG